MEYLEYFLYGIIQGLTEFIPVSSTAHLKVISLFLGISDPGSSLSAIIQFGSVLATIWYFRNGIFLSNKKSFVKYFSFLLQKKIVKSISLGTIPIIFLGGFIKLFFQDFFDENLRSNFSIAIISLLMAAIMYLADISKTKFINIKNHNYFHSLLIGSFQAFAIFPGVSRSGITISIALLSGWERNDAAKFSFLLGIPAISLAAIVEFILSLYQIQNFNFLPLIIGIISSFFSSLFAIDFLIRYITSKGIRLFVFYRVLFGFLVLLHL